MTIFERTKELAKEQGLTLRQVEEKAGLGTNSLYRWKTYNPSTKSVTAVADVLNVSVDYLLGNTDDKKLTMHPQEQEVDLETLTDVDNIKNRLVSFGGKPVTEHDAKVISQFLKTYYEGRD